MPPAGHRPATDAADGTLRLARTAAEAIRGPNRPPGHEPAWASRPSPTTSSPPGPGRITASGSCSRPVTAPSTPWRRARPAARPRPSARIAASLADPAPPSIYLGDARPAAIALADAINAASSGWPPISGRAPQRHRPRNTDDREPAGPLRLHPHAVRPRPGPRHAAPPRRPQRSRRPASAGASPTAAWACSPAKSAPARRVAVRTALAGLDASRHTLIYLPNPLIGVRGIHEAIVATFGGHPARTALPAHRPGRRRARRRARRARPHPRPGHRRSPPAALRAARDHPHAHQPRPRRRLARWPACSSASPPCGAP